MIQDRADEIAAKLRKAALCLHEGAVVTAYELHKEAGAMIDKLIEAMDQELGGEEDGDHNARREAAPPREHRLA